MQSRTEWGAGSEVGLELEGKLHAHIYKYIQALKH